MGIEWQSEQNQAESLQELRVLQQELAPVFDPQFFTFGHGTNIGNVSSILTEGLRAASHLLQSTVTPLEDTPKGMKNILHWPHHDHKAIIVICIPTNAPRDAELFDRRQTENQYDQQYVLPPRFIRGYIDVEQRKFIPNPTFEEKPTFNRRDSVARAPEMSFSSSTEGPVEIPAPKEGQGPAGDIF